MSPGYWYSFFSSWLLLFWILGAANRVLRSLMRPPSVPRRPGIFLLVCGLAAALVLWIPVGGIPFGRWLSGLNLPPSIPLLALLLNSIWKRQMGTALLEAPDSRAAWLFGGVGGTLLYPLALGIGKWDPYAWGWNFSPLLVMVALLTIYLGWRHNRFGAVLFLCIVAYDLQALESRNFWDYLLDPVYWLLSLVQLVRQAVKRMQSKPEREEFIAQNAQ